VAQPKGVVDDYELERIEIQKNYARFFYIGCDILVITASYSCDESKLEDIFKNIIRE